MIKIQKLDILGEVVDTIELEGRYRIITTEKAYLMSDRYIEEIKPNLKKIQGNFCDNM